MPSILTGMLNRPAGKGRRYKSWEKDIEDGVGIAALGALGMIASRVVGAMAGV